MNIVKLKLIYIYEMSVDVQFLKKQIYTSIVNIKNHEIIINYIKMYNIIYTSNSNGIFINLDVLDEDTIIKLHELITKIQKEKTDIIEDRDQYLNTIISQPKQIEHKKSKKSIKTKYKRLQIKKEIDKQIINYSKMYTIEKI